MKCQQCVEEGLTSRVFSRGATRTLMAGGGEHWDEEGVRHYHEINTENALYECSNKHLFCIKGKPECGAEGCAYGGWSAQLVVERPAPKPSLTPENSIVLNRTLTFPGMPDNVSGMTATALQNRQR